MQRNHAGVMWLIACTVAHAHRPPPMQVRKTSWRHVLALVNKAMHDSRRQALPAGECTNKQADLYNSRCVVGLGWVVHRRHHMLLRLHLCNASPSLQLKKEKTSRQTCRERLVVHLAQHREVAQVAAVVPGGAGPVHRHLPHVHHTTRHYLIHIGLHQKRKYGHLPLQLAWAPLWTSFLVEGSGCSVP